VVTNKHTKKLQRQPGEVYILVWQVRPSHHPMLHRAAALSPCYSLTPAVSLYSALWMVKYTCFIICCYFWFLYKLHCLASEAQGFEQLDQSCWAERQTNIQT